MPRINFVQSQEQSSAPVLCQKQQQIGTCKHFYRTNDFIPCLEAVDRSLEALPGNIAGFMRF